MRRASETSQSRINVMLPWLGEAEAQALAEVVASGWVAQGPKVAEFERQFEQTLQASYAVATSSCTTALQLALMAAGVERGDDVVVPSFSFIATANAASYVGARAVFADVDVETGNLTPATVEAAITPRTRAVIVVDQGGVPADLAAIRACCDPRGIVVVEDAACAAGSTYRGRPVGASAEVATWSFHPRKIITTGEGGMFTTEHEAWAARARTLREHAMSVSAASRHASVLAPAEEYTEVGFNFRMTDLQAAVGIVQLARLSEIVRRRREIARAYIKAIDDLEGLRPVDDPPWGTTNFQAFWIELGQTFPLTRDQLVARFAEANISVRRGIMAAHQQPAYAEGNHGSADLSVTEHLTDRTLILPIFHQMSESEQARVIDVLRRAEQGR